MANGINKTNNAVVAPDIGNMVKAFVQNETVQKVADVYMEAIKSLNPTPPQHYRGFTERCRQVGTIRRVLDEALVANGFDRVLGRHANIEIEQHAAVNMMAEFTRERHAAIIRMAVLREEPAVGIQDIIEAKPQATESIRMLYHRGFRPTGNEEVKVLLLGLINMFK